MRLRESDLFNEMLTKCFIVSVREPQEGRFREALAFLFAKLVCPEAGMAPFLKSRRIHRVAVLILKLENDFHPHLCQICEQREAVAQSELSLLLSERRELSDR